MSTFSRAVLQGNLGGDPVLRFTKAGTPVCDLRVATNEEHTNREGQVVKRTQWHTVVVWGKQAENCAKYLRKGRLVRVEGRFQTRKYVAKDQQERETTEVIANSVRFMDAPRRDNAEKPQE